MKLCWLRGRQEHRNVATLRFVRADVYAVPFHRAFDIVTAARVLQWVGRPGDAVRALSEAVKPLGTLLVLDYDHEQLQWTPSPPASMRRFYSAFLRWRADACMDNSIALHLASVFESVGLTDIHVTPQLERTARGDSDFSSRVEIWADVAGTRGRQMVADGFLTETQRATAEADYREWVQSDAEAMTMYLLAVEGTRAR